MINVNNTIKHKIDADGYYIEDVWTSETAGDLIEFPVPAGMFKAQWTGSEWVDVEAYKRDELDALQYIQLRKAEYPPIEEYLDAVVKGDEEQKQKYIEDCLAVKAKYPKGA